MVERKADMATNCAQPWPPPQYATHAHINVIILSTCKKNTHVKSIISYNNYFIKGGFLSSSIMSLKT